MVAGLGVQLQDAGLQAVAAVLVAGENRRPGPQLEELDDITHTDGPGRCRAGGGFVLFRQLVLRFVQASASKEQGEYLPEA